MKKHILIAAATAVVASSTSTAAIAVVGSTTFNDQTSNFSFTFDASSADKLVVVVTGEHGF